MKFNGEFSGDTRTKDVKLKGEFEANIASDGTGFSTKVDFVILGSEDKNESYFNYKEISGQGESAEDYEKYFEPVLGKWVKVAELEEDTSASFQEDGSVATLEILGVFTGFGDIGEKERNAYLSAFDTHKAITVDEKIEKVKFNGVDARKLKVRVNKDAFKKMDEEASKNIANEDTYQKFDENFVDEFFGTSSELVADVYVDKKKAQIIGVEFKVKPSSSENPDSEIYDQTFGTKIGNISTSLFFEYGKEADVKAPEKSITEDELNELFFNSSTTLFDEPVETENTIQL